MRGVYVLLIRVAREEVLRVGSLGELRFKPGRYAYVGKAVGIPVERRLKRHSRRDKRPRRHVDRLTIRRGFERAYLTDCRSEAECVRRLIGLGRKPAFKGFGSSDDPEAETHLLYRESPAVPDSRSVIA